MSICICLYIYMHVCLFAQVSLCRIYCRMWPNVKFWNLCKFLLAKERILTFLFEAWLFLDNNQIKIWNVRSQVDKVWVIFVNDREWACKVNSNFSRMIRIKKIVRHWHVWEEHSWNLHARIKYGSFSKEIRKCLYAESMS